ncbi:TonB-dependent receptor [Brevundimonas sp. UBA7664]|uniref:TonB-dependent receptor n=1 Tax=Brevundimonas sp. UBA7664 TaxID=1946141 RepID=UPI0025BFC236|nr:TonB-dependent receptor [Brevundimonas sp. UBA7664]
MRLTNLLRTTVSAAVVGACAFGFAGVASAQDAPQESATSIDDIIVTAQKREQNLQDVPIVVTTLSQETLEGAGVRDIKDLQILTPGLIVTSTTNESVTTARIRGVGTVADNPGIESSVGIVIDGVYRSRNGVGFGDLGELSRVEILKGPQGTLFGKNTSAGVINIISEAPSFTPGFQGEITGGNFGAFGASASVTGGITDQVAGRLYVGHRERDGFYNVTIPAGGPRTETDDQNQDFWTARGQLLILPSDSASIRIIADYSDRSEYCCVASQVITGPTGAIINALTPGGTGIRGPVTPNYAAATPHSFSRDVYANRPTEQFIEDMGLSAEANIDLDSMNATLTSVTAWRNWESVNGGDIDFSGADLFYRDSDGSFSFALEQVSQELRLAGSTDRVDWLVGGLWSHEDLQRNDSFLFGGGASFYLSALLASQAGLPGSAATFLSCATAPFPFNVGCGLGGFVAPGAPGLSIAPGSGYKDRYSQGSESFALFTNNTFRVTEQFELTLGLRYTKETKEMMTNQDNIGGNGAICAAARANPLFAPPSPLNGFLGGGFCINQLNTDFDGRTYLQEFEDDDISGKFAAQYRFNDSLMVYASYARGFKAGGFNLERSSGPTVVGNTNPSPIDDTSFASETVQSYELGFKSTLFDRSLLLNATAYEQNFENFQLNTFVSPNFIVESIPELNSRGVDLDFFWFTPLEGLSFSGGATWTESEYGMFTAADLQVPSRFPALSLLPGNTVSFAPEYTGSVAMNFDRSIGNGLRLGLNLAAKYTTEYNTGSDLLPAKMQDAFTVVNGRITIGSEDDRWALDLWAQNLTDEEYYQVVFNGPLQGSAFSTLQPNGTYYNPAADTTTYDAFLGAPRTYGLTLRVKY